MGCMITEGLAVSAVEHLSSVTMLPRVDVNDCLVVVVGAD